VAGEIDGTNLALYVFFAKNRIMRVAVVANDLLKTEWLARGNGKGIEWIWLDAPAPVTGASACIDLLYTGEPGRLQAWQYEPGTLVLINDVLKKDKEVPPNCLRFNGWLTFLNRPVIEIARADKEFTEKTVSLFAALDKTVEWVPDLPGFVSARVVCMILNEAWFALEEGVSTKAEIDTAMKLGTNYPFGPFEWGEKIGWQPVYQLLEKLAAENIRYTPAALLKEEAFRK
jgi:3-hydroxybutyryl-CoA dehydrogenase